MLLNKHNLNIAKLASKEESRFTLCGIHVTPRETVVTDGHSLMHVTTVALPADGFPVLKDSGLTAHDEFKPFNLSAESALKAMASIPKRSPIPVLACAAVAVNGDPNHPRVVTTDLENQASYPASETANFPDWERVMPKKADMTLTIGLDARKLKALMDQFAAFCDADNKRSNAVVTFSFKDGKSTAMMECTRQDQTMTALLMPCSL